MLTCNSFCPALQVHQTCNPFLFNDSSFPFKKKKLYMKTQWEEPSLETMEELKSKISSNPICLKWNIFRSRSFFCLLLSSPPSTPVRNIPYKTKITTNRYIPIQQNNIDTILNFRCSTNKLILLKNYTNKFIHAFSYINSYTHLCF